MYIFKFMHCAHMNFVILQNTRKKAILCTQLEHWQCLSFNYLYVNLKLLHGVRINCFFTSPWMGTLSLTDYKELRKLMCVHFAKIKR